MKFIYGKGIFSACLKLPKLTFVPLHRVNGNPQRWVKKLILNLRPFHEGNLIIFGEDSTTRTEHFCQPQWTSSEPNAKSLFSASCDSCINNLGNLKIFYKMLLIIFHHLKCFPLCLPHSCSTDEFFSYDDENDSVKILSRRLFLTFTSFSFMIIFHLTANFLLIS